MKICKGIKDKNNGCTHEWIYILNSDKTDNMISEAYFNPICVKCGLLCRIKIPANCYIEEKEKTCKFVKTEDFENPRNKSCEECGHV